MYAIDASHSRSLCLLFLALLSGCLLVLTRCGGGGRILRLMLDGRENDGQTSKWRARRAGTANVLALQIPYWLPVNLTARSRLQTLSFLSERHPHSLGTMSRGRDHYAIGILPTLVAAIILGSTSYAVPASAASSRFAPRVDSSWRRDVIGVPPIAWNTVMEASGCLALMDLHELHGRDTSQFLQQLRRRLPPPVVRGGACGLGGNGRGGRDTGHTNAADPRQPHVSVSTAWSKPSSPRQSATKEAIVSNNVQPSISTLDGKMSSRSGARPSTASALSSPSLLATMLAALWSSWNILNGALLTFTPKDSYDVAAYLVDAIGVVRISHGLQLFLSTVARVPSKTSMGVAILPRLLFLIACLAMKTYEQLGVQTTASPMVLISAGVMSVAAIALLSDRGRPNLLANLFSTMTFVKGCGFMFRPDRTAGKLFGFDGAASATAANLGKVPAKVRSLGFHLIISSVFMNALTHSINPIKAAGYSAVAYSLFLAYLAFVVGGYRSLSAVPRTYLFFLASALACSFVFLLDKGRMSSNVSNNLASAEDREGKQMVWRHGANVPLGFVENPSDVEYAREYEVEEVDDDNTSSDFSDVLAYHSNNTRF